MPILLLQDCCERLIQLCTSGLARLVWCHRIAREHDTPFAVVDCQCPMYVIMVERKEETTFELAVP